MSKIEKFTGSAAKSLSFAWKNMKWILLSATVVLAVLLFRQCDLTRRAKDENRRLENNLLATNDTLKNYKKNGYNVAEMRALRLRVDELADSLKMERGKTPVTIINYTASITDTFHTPAVVIKDTVREYTHSDCGVLSAERSDTFGRSSRDVSVEIPYTVDAETGELDAGECGVRICQDIWLETSLYKNKKGETFIRLKTDYPGAEFNNGLGISVENGKDYDYYVRKQFAVGIGVHAGYGVAFPDGRIQMSPYVGVGIGLQWNPRFAQF